MGFLLARNATSGGARRLRHSVLMLAAGWLAIAAGVIGFRSPVSAFPMIEVSATLTSTPVYFFEDATFSVVVTNTGTEPFPDVAIAVRWESANMIAVESAIIVGPVAPAGNGDDVLDVAEQWVYEVIVPTLTTIHFDVSAGADGSEHARASTPYRFGDFPGAFLPPIGIVTVADRPSVVVGERVRWTIAVSNLIDKGLVLSDERGGHRVLHPNVREPVGWAFFGAPVDQGDGDEVLAPGESWQWHAEYAVEVDGSYLDSYVVARVPTLPYAWQFSWKSDVLVVEPPPSTTPSPSPSQPAPTTSPTPAGETLPGTGGDSTTATAALALVTIIAGVVMIIATRIRRRPEASWISPN